jgi:hypothetical protein
MIHTSERIKRKYFLLFRKKIFKNSEEKKNKVAMVMVSFVKPEDQNTKPGSSKNENIVAYIFVWYVL